MIKGGDLNIPPLVAKLVDSEALEAMGVKRQSKNTSEEAPDVGASTVDNSTDQTKH